MKIGHLYKITRKSTGEYYYGIHKGTTFDGYWGSGVIVRDYIKTHGTDDLEYSVLVIGHYDYIIDIESKIVTESEVINEQCWNLKTGGYRGIPGERTRKLISESGKGRKYSEDRQLKIQQSREKNKKEIYKKVSESNIGRIRTQEQRENISKMKKEKMTPESRKRLSESKIGNKNPAWKGYIKTPDGFFMSSIPASKYYNVKDKTILDRCKSKNPLFIEWQIVDSLPENTKLLG